PAEQHRGPLNSRRRAPLSGRRPDSQELTMARFQYADSLADFPVNSAGKPLTNLDINVWTSKTGGALVTDLLDASGTPSTVARSDDFAGIAFSGPDGYSGTLWLEGLGGVRRRVSPVGTPE